MQFIVLRREHRLQFRAEPQSQTFTGPCIQSTPDSCERYQPFARPGSNRGPVGRQEVESIDCSGLGYGAPAPANVMARETRATRMHPRSK